MFTKRDQESIAKAYNLISEMNLGPAGAGLQPVGKPVIITMDMPGAQPELEPNHEEEEHDPSEIEMAASELHKIGDYIPKLKEMVTQMPSLEGWVSSKITKASDYISSVYHWLEYQQHEGSTSQPEGMFGVGYENSIDCDK
jgi:hypothetical protein